MGVYDRQIATALRMIREKGELCVWASSTQAEANDSEPWNGTPSESVPYEDTPIVFFPLNQQWSELIRYLRGTEVQSGSLYGIMPQVEFSPQLTDSVTRSDGSVLRPLAIDPLSPNGEIILYTIRFNK